MTPNTAVLVIGMLPELVDFTSFPGLTAEKVRAGISAQLAALGELGYAAEGCYVDRGETAEAVLRALLAERDFACIVVGAGIRTAPPHFLLFEKVINILHEHAPRAKIAFNTNPTDTVDAVRRWA
jgi:hypothetical protein